MAFVVSARKYRPQRFDEVVGQEHITTTLKNAITSGRIAHAYLLTGPRGVGKTTTARILAKSINCEHPENAEPCNKCEMCLSIQTSQLIDIIEIDAASNRGIDEIRTLRDSVRYAPSKGKYKVYIIDEVHMLTKDSFNAFLKTLEEPPEHIVFIFATTDVHRVPLTILSRCQRYDFRRIQLDTIKAQLQYIADTENITIDDKTLTLIARKADGGLRDAESYFDQVVAFCGKDVNYETVTKLLNVIDNDLFFRISDAVLTKNYKIGFDVSDTLYRNGWNYADFIEQLIEHFRNIMVAVVTNSTELVEAAEIYKTQYKNYAPQFSESDLLRILTFLGRVAQELRYSQNHKLKIEITLSQLIGFEKTETILHLIDEAKKQNPGLSASESAKPIHAATKKIAPEKIITRETEEPVSVTFDMSDKKKPVFEGAAAPSPKKAPSGAVTIDVFKNKWDEFRQLIATEKPVMLGGFVQYLTPVTFERSVLTVQVSDSAAMNLFSQKQNLDYVTKKAFVFFEAKLTIKLVEVAGSAPTKEPGAKGTSKTPLTKNTANDEYGKFIIDELGGERIA